MSVLYYDVYRNPSPDSQSEETATYHVRPVRNQSVSTEKLRDQRGTTLTSPDIVAALDVLRRFLIEHLGEGQQVYVEGIGYFQPTLELATLYEEEVHEGKKVETKRKIVATSPEQIRAEHVQIKSIAFRPEKKFMADLKSLKGAITRSPLKSHSTALSETEIDARLTEHFRYQPTIDRAQFEILCGLTSTTARRQLQRLREAGRLRNLGKRNSPIYEPVHGFYQRPDTKR